MRVVIFLVILLALVGLAIAGIAWYGRDSYFVGLRDGQVTIFQGRPGGVLWIKPTVVRVTSVAASQIEPHNLPTLEAGQTVSSVSAADAYVDSLKTEEQQALAAQKPPPTTTTTTKPR